MTRGILSRDDEVMDHRHRCTCEVITQHRNVYTQNDIF